MFAVFFACACLEVSLAYLLHNNDEYQVWLTTGDGTKNLSREAPCPVTAYHHGYSVWVDRNKRRQTIEGFGAALTNSAAYVIFQSPLRNKILSDLFGSGVEDLGNFVFCLFLYHGILRILVMKVGSLPILISMPDIVYITCILTSKGLLWCLFIFIDKPFYIVTLIYAMRLKV